MSRRSSRDAQPEGMVPSLAPWLIRLAARSAPASLAERLEEEWLADLAARRGPIARLRLALGCCWAARVITHEHAVVNLLGAAAAAGHKIMSGSAQHDSSFFSRRTTAVLLIVCLHGLLICGLAVGLGPIIHAMPPDISATVLPGPSKPEGSARSSDASPEFTPIHERPPEVPLIPIPDASPIREVATESLFPPAAPAQPVNRFPGGPGKGFPTTNDYYPPAAIRLRETGSAAVQVCVDARGRLTTDPIIAQSSGSARLDEGALRVARAGTGHYRATTEDGRPVSSCYSCRIRFELRE